LETVPGVVWFSMGPSFDGVIVPLPGNFVKRKIDTNGHQYYFLTRTNYSDKFA
jgi:hypothetical protein